MTVLGREHFTKAKLIGQDNLYMLYIFMLFYRFLVNLLIFQLIALPIAATTKYSTLAPTTAINKELTTQTEIEKLVILYIKEHPNEDLTFPKDLYTTMSSESFLNWVLKRNFFSPLHEPTPYKGWKIIQKMKQKQAITLKTIISIVSISLGVLSSFYLASIYPLLISLFPGIILLTPLFSFISFSIPFKKSPDQIQIQTEIPSQMIHELHRDQEKKRFPPANFRHYDMTEMGHTFPSIKHTLAKKGITFDRKKALIIGPGQTIIEIVEVLKAFPELEELHIVAVENVNAYYEQLRSLSEDFKFKTKIFLHRTSVLAMPKSFKNNFSLILMRHVLDLEFFTESQALQAMVDIHASLSKDGIFIGSELEGDYIDNFRKPARFNLFEHIIRPIETVKNQFVVVYAQAKSKFWDSFLNNKNNLELSA